MGHGAQGHFIPCLATVVVVVAAAAPAGAGARDPATSAAAAWPGGEQSSSSSSSSSPECSSPGCSQVQDEGLPSILNGDITLSWI